MRHEPKMWYLCISTSFSSSMFDTVIFEWWDGRYLVAQCRERQSQKSRLNFVKVRRSIAKKYQTTKQKGLFLRFFCFSTRTLWNTVFVECWCSCSKPKKCVRTQLPTDIFGLVVGCGEKDEFYGGNFLFLSLPESLGFGVTCDFAHLWDLIFINS